MHTETTIKLPSLNAVPHTVQFTALVSNTFCSVVCESAANIQLQYTELSAAILVPVRPPCESMGEKMMGNY